MKFTQGEWKFERMATFEEWAKLTGTLLKEHEGYFRGNDGSWMVVTEDGPIAVVAFKKKAKRGQGYLAPDPEGMANARLIAAAPTAYELISRAIADCIDEKWLQDARTYLEVVDANS